MCFRKLDKEMEITASKHLSKSFMDSRNGSPRYLNMTLDNNIDTEEFLKVCGKCVMNSFFQLC